MKENFVIKIESMHLADRGDTENVCCLNMFSSVGLFSAA